MVIHFLAKLLFWRQKVGAVRFIPNYRQDGIFPLTERERPLVPAWQRCTGCGLCEAICPLPLAAEGGVLALPLAEWRDLTAHKLVAARARQLAECGACGLCEDVCPEEVPLGELVEFVIRYAENTAA